jgi:hypothetical protein
MNLNLNDLELQVLIPLSLGILGALVALVRGISRQQAIAFVTRYTPDQVDALAELLAGRAYDAVEQLAEAYGEMTREEKQETAIKLIQQLAAAIGWALKQDAAKAMMESHIRQQRVSERQ